MDLLFRIIISMSFKIFNYIFISTVFNPYQLREGASFIRKFETKYEIVKSLERYFEIDEVPDGPSNNSHSCMMFRVHIFVILMHTFELRIIMSPSFLHTSDVFYQILGVKLEWQNPFIFWDKHLVLTVVWLSNAGESFRYVNDVISMKLVYFRDKIFNWVKFVQIADLSIGVLFQRDILQTPSHLSFLNPGSMDIGQKLMSETKAYHLELFVDG